jgi:5'-deoxynucleotidase
MKLIQRWSLMNNMRSENVQEHSLQVAIIGHALAVIGNKYFNKNYSPERVALLAIFHDASEVLTGDLPTPVKYFNSDIRDVYKGIEEKAIDKLLSLLPEELIKDYDSIFKLKELEKDLWPLVKGADSLSAYIKCLEEGNSGNLEFNRAKQTIMNSLKEMDLEEVNYFLENFIDSFSLSLDDLGMH